MVEQQVWKRSKYRKVIITIIIVVVVASMAAAFRFGPKWFFSSANLKHCIKCKGILPVAHLLPNQRALRIEAQSHRRATTTTKEAEKRNVTLTDFCLLLRPLAGRVWNRNCCRGRRWMIIYYETQSTTTHRRIDSNTRQTIQSSSHTVYLSDRSCRLSTKCQFRTVIREEQSVRGIEGKFVEKASHFSIATSMSNNYRVINYFLMK